MLWLQAQESLQRSAPWVQLLAQPDKTKDPISHYQRWPTADNWMNKKKKIILLSAICGTGTSWPSDDILAVNDSPQNHSSTDLLFSSVSSLFFISPQAHHHSPKQWGVLFFLHLFFTLLSFGTFKFMVLKISDYWKEAEKRREGEKERERELEARGCPLGTEELSADDLKTSLIAETLGCASVCEVVSLLETRTVVV